MRNFSLSDNAASELWTALNNSAPAPAPLPPAQQPVPAPALAAPQSELERIIAGIEYRPVDAGFPNGWPTMVLPQPTGVAGNGEGTPYQWIATNSKGGGYYTLRAPLEKPLVDVTANANPYVVPGLWAVITSVGTPQQREKAWAHLRNGYPTNYGDIVNGNVDADPQWKGALAQLVAGKGVDEAYAVASQEKAPAFSKDQLAAALQAFYSL